MNEKNLRVCLALGKEALKAYILGIHELTADVVTCIGPTQKWQHQSPVMDGEGAHKATLSPQSY